MIIGMQQIDNFADRFLPPDASLSPSDRQREHVFVIAHLASPVCVVILSAMLYGLAGVDTPQFFGLMLGFVSFYAYPLLLKRVISFRTASYLSTAQLTVMIFLTVYFFGGWSSFALPWFASLPMAGMLYLGFRGAYTTSALAVTGLLVLLILNLLGHGFPNPIPNAWQTPMLMASIVLCVIFNTGIAFLHVRLHSLSQDLLQERDTLSMQIQEMAALGSWEIDYENNLVTWSDEVYRMIGLKKSEYNGCPDSFLTYVHPEDRDRVAQQAKDLRKGKDLEYTYRLLRPDGDMRSVHVQATIISRVDGVPCKARGFIQDITERAKTEDALRASEVRLAEFQEIANVGSWDLYIARDKPDKSHWSAGLCRIYGIEKDAFPRDFESYLTYVHEADRDRARRTWTEAFESDTPFADEYRIVRPDGTVRFTIMQARLLQDQRLGTKHWIGTTTDVTEQTLARDQLQQAQKMEAIGQLTGGIAHDFNNLLTVILGSLELIETRVKGDSTVRALVERGIKASGRGADLTDRLLAFSRKLSLNPTALDLDHLVLNMTDMLRRTLGEMIEIRTLGDVDLWRCHADQSQLENALLNLSINARDAMPEGGVLTIETANISLDEEAAAAHENLEPGDYVMLGVSDTGGGIESDILKHVFEPFFTTKEVGKGSGLGLSMVYGFSKQSGGNVTIESAPGKGTAIKIFLPRALMHHDVAALSPVAAVRPSA